MALSQGSVITISDINAEFDTKIDSAGTGLSKSGTSLSLASLHSASGSAGPTTNATPAYGATFTVPQINYDTYGRVTGYTNRTVKIPATPTITNISGTAATATATPNVACAYRSDDSGVICYNCSKSGSNVYLPSGGTWRYITDTAHAGQIAGGNSISLNGTVGSATIAIRVA